MTKVALLLLSSSPCVKLKITKRRKSSKKLVGNGKIHKKAHNLALLMAQFPLAGCQSRHLRESESGEPPAIDFARGSRILPRRCGKRKFCWLASAFGNSEFGGTHGKKRQNNETRQKHAIPFYHCEKKSFEAVDVQSAGRFACWIGEKKVGFGAVFRLANSLVLGRFGGSKSGIKWLSIGFVAVLPIKKEFPRTFFQSVFSGNGF